MKDQGSDAQEHLAHNAVSSPEDKEHSAIILLDPPAESSICLLVRLGRSRDPTGLIDEDAVKRALQGILQEVSAFRAAWGT